MLAYLAAVVVVLVPCLYMLAASSLASRFPSLQNKRICLLIAHPDDEAMFFAPTVLALTRPDTGNHVKILCLSTGDADGLGETRKKELVKSAMLLGLRDEDDVFVVDNQTDFPDSMTKTWDEAKVSSLLCSAFAPHIEHQRDTEQPQANIDVLITFDAQGVSSHPNHISLYHGARAFLSALVRGKSGWRPPVDLYTLTSVAMPRKYSSVLDALTTVALWFASSRGAVDKDPEHPASLVFMSQLTGAGDKGSGPPTLGTAWRAMTEAHSSQMRWFRYGWISMSRYMIINDLRLEKAAGEE